MLMCAHMSFCVLMCACMAARDAGSALQLRRQYKNRCGRCSTVRPLIKIYDTVGVLQLRTIF